jgi:hypothetical protein
MVNRQHYFQSVPRHWVSDSIGVIPGREDSRLIDARATMISLGMKKPASKQIPNDDLSPRR